MKQLLLTLTIGFATETAAQTTYYRYNPSTGTSEKIGYSQPTNSYPYSTYTPHVDLGLYQNVLATKQAAYNRNRASLRERVDDIDEALTTLYEVNREAADYYEVKVQEYIDLVNKGNYDYSNESIYYSIRDGLNKYYRAIRKEITNSSK